MTTVAILPVETATGTQAFQAFAGSCLANGNTAGEALDELSRRYPELNEEGLIVVQRFLPDAFFSAAQQRRLQELMSRWRTARDADKSLPDEEQAELDALIDAELQASAARAAWIADGMGR